MHIEMRQQKAYVCHVHTTVHYVNVSDNIRYRKSKKNACKLK